MRVGVNAKLVSAFDGPFLVKKIAEFNVMLQLDRKGHERLGKLNPYHGEQLPGWMDSSTTVNQDKL